MVRGSQSWSIDVVAGRGPALAEIAAPLDTEIRLPRWLNAVLVREVTSEKAYEDERIVGTTSADSPRGWCGL